MLPELACKEIKALPGSFHSYIFENPNVGIPPTLFYDFKIPLEPFKTGLDDEDEYTHTSFRFDFVKLDRPSWKDLDGKNMAPLILSASNSMYLGSAHNPVNILSMQLTRETGANFKISADVECDFEFEGVAKNQTYHFETSVAFEGLKFSKAEALKLHNISPKDYISKFISEQDYIMAPVEDDKILRFPPRFE